MQILKTMKQKCLVYAIVNWCLTIFDPSTYILRFQFHLSKRLNCFKDQPWYKDVSTNYATLAVGRNHNNFYEKKLISIHFIILCTTIWSTNFLLYSIVMISYCLILLSLNLKLEKNHLLLNLWHLKSLIHCSINLELFPFLPSMSVLRNLSAWKLGKHLTQYSNLQGS